MAFLQDTTSDNGIDVIKAFHKITFLNGTEERINITLSAFPSIEIYEENKDIRPLFSKQYYFEPNMEIGSFNLFEQGYNYLKSLNEYEKAIDME